MVILTNTKIFRVAVIICLLIKQLIFLDSDELHPLAHSSLYHLTIVQGLAIL
ncbi:hypothetical protein VIAG107301_13415 [Vibrio agarivorans]